MTAAADNAGLTCTRIGSGTFSPLNDRVAISSGAQREL
jgi:hypothetical protein